MREHINFKNILIVICVVALLSALAAYLTQWLRSDEYVLPPKIVDAPAPSSNIGKTTAEELRARPGLISEVKTSENGSEFSFDSGLYLHPDVVETTDNVVSYEAVTIVPNEGATTPHMVDYLAKYGDPELIVEGSKRYGPFFRTYVYPSLGFAFVGNPATDEIYEFEYFAPMTTEQYSTTYGESFKTPQQTEVEH